MSLELTALVDADASYLDICQLQTLQLCEQVTDTAVAHQAGDHQRRRFHVDQRELRRRLLREEGRRA